MSFSGIVSQERPIKILQQQIKSDRLSHAYLFTGPDAIGKRLFAKNFAKVLNCQDVKENTEFIDCCDKCPSCKKIENFNHPDIGWLKPEGARGSIKIEDIRQLQDALFFKPYEAKWKFYIVLDADFMTEQASNALLKTLEEPPKGSILILTTNNIHRLLDTIVSRCQIVKFSPLKLKDRQEILIRSFDLN